MPESMHKQTSSQGRIPGRAVACRDCRHKKLKCDLEYPVCGRCRRRGALAQCVYDNGTPSRLVRSKKTSHRGTRAVDIAGTSQGTFEPRIMVSTVRALTDGQNLTQSKFTGPTLVQESSSHMSGNWSGRESLNASKQQVGMKTVMKGDVIRYRGNGIVANLLLQLPDVQSLMGELRSSSRILDRMSNDLGHIKKKVHKSRLEGPAVVPNVTILLSLLPPRPIVQELVELYIQYIELTHRIVHIPSFKKQLEEFWINMKSTSAAFIVQLLLVIACAEVLFEADQLPQAKSAPAIPRRFPVIDWIHYSERWIDTSGPKWPDLTMLRIHCLLIVAKNSQCLNQNRSWLATGNLVRLAMLAGYHRDPKYIGNIDPFTIEMRRRIWITILELDVQASLDLGLRPCIEASSFDTMMPLNVDDDELYEEMLEIPNSKPTSDMTDSSFQIILAKSLPLRLTICAEMHSPTLSCTYEDVIKYELTLEQMKTKFPERRRNDSEDEMQAMKYDLWTSVLETKLSQTLLTLHTPFVTGATATQRVGQSSRTQLEASMAILSRQCRLHKMSMKISLCHLSYSTFQAALSVLHYLYTDHMASNSPVLSNGPPVFAHCITIVEEVLGSLENKLLPVVKGVKHYFLLSIILIVVKVKLWPDQAETIKKTVTDHLGSVVYSIVAYNANGLQSSQAKMTYNDANQMEPPLLQETYYNAVEDTFPHDSNLSNAITEASSFWEDLLDWNGSLSLPFPQ